jgi:hypothetical protein
VYNGHLHLFTNDAGAPLDRVVLGMGSLRHDWWDGRRWNFETLDGPGGAWPGHTTDPVGVSNSVAVYNGRLHVFTFDSFGTPVYNGIATEGILRHDWWDGRRWNFQILDGAGSAWAGHSTDKVGAFNSVAVYNTHLHVFTYDATTGSLRHDWWDGRRWNFQTLVPATLTTHISRTLGSTMS